MQKKKCWQKCFAFLNAYYPYAHLIKALNSLNSFKPCARLLENKKSGGCNE